MENSAVCDDKLYLDTLEEEIFILNNVITYKWLIRTLKVSANTAKQMLYEFVEKQNSAGIKLGIYYLVVGQMANTDKAGVPAHEICIVPSSQLESIKAKFQHVSGEHIYGIHKANLQDQNALYVADYIATHDKLLL